MLYDNCEGFRNFINNFIENIKQFFINGWNAIVSFFTETIPQWIQNVINWFGQLPYMIGYHIGQTLGSIVQFGLDIWNWVTVELPQIIQSIIQWFAELPGNIATWLLNVINNIVTWGQNVYNTAVSWISNTINGIINWFAQLPGRIYNWLVTTINNIVNWGNNMVNKGREAASNLVNRIVEIVQNLPSKMFEIGKNIVQGIWNGITGMGSWIGGKISGFFSGIVKGAQKALRIGSPSKVFRDEVGRFIPQGVAVGVEADTDSALKAIDNMNDDIMDEMNRAVAIETGSINARATVKSNNSMMNIIKATFNLDGSVDIDGQKAGRIMTPYFTKTIKAGGIA